MHVLRLIFAKFGESAGYCIVLPNQEIRRYNMGTLMDLLDDYILGPLNLLDAFEGWLYAVKYQDTGYELAIPCMDKGGKFSLNEVRALLRHYGIATYGRRFDAQNMYIRVKKRQARWAEYILLHAGVELRNPTFDRRNPGYVAQHEPGWMPTAWADQSNEQKTVPGEEQEDAEEVQPWWQSWLQIFD